jgi:signal transduction histidine kinase
MSKNRRILVIDDNESIHNDFRSVLSGQEERGRLEHLETALFGGDAEPARKVAFEVDCATQGQKGYAMVLDALKAARPYATAFVDMRMPPGWDGIETVERIWAQDRNLQVVICTAYSDYPWDKIIRKLGHSDQLLILKKPFDTIEVLQLALALTEKWNLTNRVRRHVEDVENEVRSRTRELQEFAYSVSHDLQEPLRKVTAFGERLRDKCETQLGPEGIDYLTRMRDAAKRMSTLINDLLALSRVTTQAKPCTPVNLNTLVSEVLSDLDVRIEQVHGNVEVGSLPTIHADPTQMRQLFQNLIGNALKFHKPEVAPFIKVQADLMGKTELFDDDGTGGHATWRIRVQDNGIGFEEKFRERIFEVFQRLHNRSEYEGSGIGLSLCRKIAQRHGGSISAESTPGQGATFLITLPETHAESTGDAEPATATTTTGTAATLETPEKPPVNVAARQAG